MMRNLKFHLIDRIQLYRYVNNITLMGLGIKKRVVEFFSIESKVFIETIAFRGATQISQFTANLMSLNC